MPDRGRMAPPGPVVLVLVLALVLSALPFAVGSDPAAVSLAAAPPMRAQAGVASVGVGSWDNGLIELSVTQPYPSFVVQSLRDPSTRASGDVDRLSEISPSGNVTASASLLPPNATWVLQSAQSAGGVTVWLNATVLVQPAGGSWGLVDEVRGLDDGGPALANVSLTFRLNASNGSAPSTVEFDLQVSAWPWIDHGDVLGMQLDEVAAPGTTLISGASPDSVAEVGRHSGRTVAVLTWAASASFAYRGGPNASAAVGSALSFPNDLNSSVLIEFSAPRGGYNELEYDPWLQLFPQSVLPPGPPIRAGPLPAWSVSSAAWATLLLVSGLVIALAVVARRARAPLREEGPVARPGPRIPSG